jgi:hypothetical protein
VLATFLWMINLPTTFSEISMCGILLDTKMIKDLLFYISVSRENRGFDIMGQVS